MVAIVIVHETIKKAISAKAPPDREVSVVKEKNRVKEIVEG